MKMVNKQKVYARVMLGLCELSRRRRIIRDLTAIAFSLSVTACLAFVCPSMVILIFTFSLFTALSYFYLKVKLGPISPFTEARKLEEKYSRFEEALSTICSYSRGKKYYSQDLYEKVLDDASLSLEAVHVPSEAPLKPTVYAVLGSVVFCVLGFFYGNGFFNDKTMSEQNLKLRMIYHDNSVNVGKSLNTDVKWDTRQSGSLISRDKIAKKLEEGIPSNSSIGISSEDVELVEVEAITIRRYLSEVSPDYGRDIERLKENLKVFEKENSVNKNN